VFVEWMSGVLFYGVTELSEVWEAVLPLPHLCEFGLVCNGKHIEKTSATVQTNRLNDVLVE